MFGFVEAKPFQGFEIHKAKAAGAGVSVSRATNTNIYIGCVKPLLNQRQILRCLTWTKEKKNWHVALVKTKNTFV